MNWRHGSSGRMPTWQAQFHRSRNHRMYDDDKLIVVLILLH
jgi:hypothetical protein